MLLFLWEAVANANWLPYTEPEAFNLLWRWLYTGELNIKEYCNLDKNWKKLIKDDQDKPVCQLTCRVHIFCESQLFDRRYLAFEVQHQLNLLIEQTDAPFIHGPKPSPSPFELGIGSNVLRLSSYPSCFKHWSTFTSVPP